MKHCSAQTKPSMTLSLIAAMGKGRVLGHQQAMPWHLPADLQHFKQLTLGKPIIMGRKTFSSIGRALPGRRNIVLTRQADFKQPGCEVFCSLTAALEAVSMEAEVMIIGGAQIYTQALPLCQTMYLTQIDCDFPGDTFFPVWSEAEWALVSSKAHQADEQNPYNYAFTTWGRQ